MNPVLPQLGIPPLGLNMGMQFMPQPMRQMQSYQKFDFPMEIQCYFKIKNVGFPKPVPKPKCRQIDPITKFFPNILEKFEEIVPPKPKPTETKLDKKNVWKDQKRELNRLKNKEKLKEWNPFDDQNIQGDPYKTIIVSRLSYETTEKKLKKEFDIYGPIKQVRIIRDKLDKPRGYAFIEFEHKRDFTTAYKNADGRKIDGRRVCVDFERGRTVPKFRPRRLGMGLGDTRAGKPQQTTLPDSTNEPRAEDEEQQPEQRGGGGGGGDREHRRKDTTKSRSRSNKDRSNKHNNNNNNRSRSRSKSNNNKQRRRDKHGGGGGGQHGNANAQNSLSRSRSRSAGDHSKRRGGENKDHREKDRPAKRHDKKRRSHSAHGQTEQGQQQQQQQSSSQMEQQQQQLGIGEQQSGENNNNSSGKQQDQMKDNNGAGGSRSHKQQQQQQSSSQQYHDRKERDGNNNNYKEHSKRDNKKEQDKGRGGGDYGQYQQQRSSQGHYQQQEGGGDYHQYSQQSWQKGGGGNSHYEEDKRAMFGMDEERFEAMQSTYQSKDPHQQFDDAKNNKKQKKNKKDKDKRRSMSRE